MTATPALEFVERLESGSMRDRWAVRFGGGACTAHVHVGAREGIEAIAREARSWLGFEHPSASTIYSCAWNGDYLVVVTDDESGPTMIEAAHQLGDLAEREAWAVAQIAGVGEALAGMAERRPQFVHRNIAGDRMIVRRDGTVLLSANLDVDVLWPHQISHAVRRAVYPALAPEETLGLRTTPATDVHRLAVELYAALALRAPFRGDNDFAVIQKIAKGPRPPAPPVSTPALGALVSRALAHDPADRPPDPAAFVAELRACTPADAPPRALAQLAAWWPRARPAPDLVGEPCRRTWNDLAATARDEIRRCPGCALDVVRASTRVIPLERRNCHSGR